MSRKRLEGITADVFPNGTVNIILPSGLEFLLSDPHTSRLIADEATVPDPTASPIFDYAGDAKGLAPDYVRSIAGASAASDAGDLDAGDASIVFQVALFDGTVVYGRTRRCPPGLTPDGHLPSRNTRPLTNPVPQLPP